MDNTVSKTIVSSKLYLSSVEIESIPGPDS